MINGAHIIVESKDATADKAFFRDVLGLEHVDVGDGWLIFALPPAEVAVHPAKKNGGQSLYLMCADVNAFVKAVKKKKLACDPVTDAGWGLLTAVTLPGGGKLGVYEPRHARPGAGAKLGPSAKRVGPAKARSTQRAGQSGGSSAKRPGKQAPAKKRR